jgi:predicted restriction endonuclease
MMAKANSVKWTREHELIALNVYYKLPFGRYHKTNQLIITVATKMRRTPSSLAMKLSNFASFDPVQQARGIKGLSGASKQDWTIWKEFHSSLDTIGPESEQLLHDLFTKDDDREVDFLYGNAVHLEDSEYILAHSGITESMATVRVRRGQQFFRQAVVVAYGVRCCISGINVPRLLVASHIKPWRNFPESRLDPQNGLCLSSLHDAAFDAGLMTLDEDYRVVLSKRLKRFLPQPSLEQNFIPFEGHQIRLPDKVRPRIDFLNYHREAIFIDKE